jgi:two-component system OmpR family sensor kinase
VSIRLRLTLWYTAVMAVTLIGGSIALYLVLANALRPARDQLLASKGNSLAANISLRASQPTASGAPRRSGLLPLYVNSLAEGDISIAVRDAEGQTTERSANLGDTDLPLSDEARAKADRGEPLYEYIFLEGTRLRLYTTPIVANGQTIGFVQVARPTGQIQQTLDSLETALLVGNSVLVLLAALVGWFLAGWSLEPVRRITRTAEVIESSGELDRRVFYKGPRDELGELAVAFNSMLGRIESAFNAQRRFVSDASHELRTPLTTLRVNLELLRKERAAAPPDWGEVLDDLALELDRLTRLVEGLLELARADAGQSIERASLELDQLLERVERQVSQLADGVSISLEGPPAGRVVGNADALTQLFLILLDNALKYTPPGGRVSLERQRNDGFVRVTVADTGPGVAPEELPRLFDRFYRTPSARGRPGTGLGLPIARWIAEQHGGKLTAESAPGRGSAFTVWLPAAPEPKRTS